MLEIGKLYKVVDYGGFYLKPLNAESNKIGYPTSEWPKVYADSEYPEDGLFGEILCYLGKETTNKVDFNKFLWYNQFVYNRYFSSIEFEYRLEEINDE